MSAAARAEARRKAILSRGGDRLAKLTTSARGEDAPAYLHDGAHSDLFYHFQGWDIDINFSLKTHPFRTYHRRAQAIF